MESRALPLGAADHLPPANVRADVLGRRFIAALLDLILLAVLFGVIAALTGGFHSQTVSNGTVQIHAASAGLSTGPLALYGVLSLGYYFAAESLTGQTLGKRLMGLQVVTLEGRGPSTGAIFVRNIARHCRRSAVLVPARHPLDTGRVAATQAHRRSLAGTTVAPV